MGTQELDAPYVATPAEAASDGALTSLATVPDGALLYPTFDAEGNRHDPVRVNFQPETTAIPEGFIADKGRVYDTRTNGLSYGWLGDTGRPSPTARRFHPLPQYDTFGLVADTSTTWTWQIALPNGTYPVAIVAGDATSLAHTNNLVVNGQILTDPDPGDDSTVPAYEQGDFDGWLVLVEVTDGVLSVTAGEGAFNPTLTHVEIGAKDQVITPEQWAEMQARLAEQIIAATARTGGSPFWNGGQTETRTYVWDPAYIDGLVAYQRTNEAGTSMYYAHSGAQYSVQAVTSESGAVVERYSYVAYGTRTVEGASNGGRSVIGLTTGFTGRALDEETGLYYFRNRMYSEKDGRFVNRDPAEYVDGASLYSAYFVPNGLDPSGETNISVAFKAFIPGKLGRKFNGAPGTWGKEPGQDPRGRSLWSYWFATDDRDFGQGGTSRVSSWGNVDSMELGIVNVFSVDGRVDDSHRLTHNKLTGNNTIETKRAAKKGNESGANTGPCESTFTFVGEASYPFSMFAPDIDYNVKFKVTVVSEQMVRVCVSGSHDGFPAYEALVNNSVIYKHMPADKGPGLVNLNSSMTVPETCVTIVADTRDCCPQ